MATDEALLESVDDLGRPVLRFYAWSEPAASFGYFQSYAAIERLTSLRPLVRRPTGGGLVPHDADWTYSLVFPTAHPWYRRRARESYAGVHTWLQAAFQRLAIETELAVAARREALGQCFVGAEPFDVLWRGRKIAGAAQRRTRRGLLIQGSVQPPPLVDRAAWQAAMVAAAGAACAVRWEPFLPDARFRDRIEHLIQTKYGQPGYHRRR
jgi:lipoate-protein ligase A